MYPFQHFLLGIAFSLSLFLLFPEIGILGVLLIFFSSVLFDIDHYFYYIIKKKNWSLKSAYHWFENNKRKFIPLSSREKNKVYMGLFILHGIEFILILFLLSFFNRIFLFLFAGLAFHLLFDIVSETVYYDRIDKFSYIWDLFKSKNLVFIEDYSPKTQPLKKLYA